MKQLKLRHIVKLLFPSPLIGIVLLSIICINSSCSKQDSPYYDYQNTTTNFNGNIYEFLQSQKGVFDSLLKVIDATPGFKDTLSNGKNLTFFAPPNNCFTNALDNLNAYFATFTGITGYKFPPVYLNNIDTMPDIDTLMARYIFNGSYPTDSLIVYGTDGLTLSSLKYEYKMNLAYQRNTATGYQNGGPQFINFTDLDNSLSSAFWVTVPTISVNIKTNNGIVHILKDSHSFGFNDFIDRFSKIYISIVTNP